MHFTKKLISAGLILVLLLGLVFHGSYYEKHKEERNERILDSTETVKVWYSDDDLTDYLTNAAVAFHEQNEGIRVIPVLVSSGEYLDTIYKESIAGNDYPDIYITSNDALEKAYLSGIASEVQNKKVLSTEHFSQVAIDAVSYKKQQIAYPLFFETSVLAYNRTYLEKWAEAVNSGEASSDKAELSQEDLKELEEAGEVDLSEGASEGANDSEEKKEEVTADTYIPKNIDELLAFSDSYNAPDGVLGVFKWDVTDVFYNYFFVGNYLNVGGPAGDDIQELDIYNANTISCLQVYQALNQFFSIDASTSSYKSTLDDFTEGKSVFTVVTSDAIKTIRDSQAEVLEKYTEADSLARNEAEHFTQIKEAEAIGGGNSSTSTSASLSGDSSKDDSSNSGSSGSGDSGSSSSDSASSSNADSDKKEETEEMTDLQKAAKELEEKVFDIEFARIPMVSTSLDAKSLSVTNAMVVNGFSKHMEAANLFAEFATTTYCGSLYQRSGKIAASTDANYEDADLKVFQDEYAHSIPLPKMMEASNYWVQLEVLFTKVWSGEDVQTLIMDLSKQLANQKIEDEE